MDDEYEIIAAYNASLEVCESPISLGQLNTSQVFLIRVRPGRPLEARLPIFVVEEFLETYRGLLRPVEVPQKERIFTPEIFSQLTGYAANLFTETECLDADRLMRDTGFADHPEAMCMLVANIMHETGNMRWLKELASGWAYEGRADLGNTQPGDGPLFKGGGILQLTGRYNYTRLSQALGDKRVITEGCDYVASTYPFTSAKTWIEENNLLDVCLTQGLTPAVAVLTEDGMASKIAARSSQSLDESFSDPRT